MLIFRLYIALLVIAFLVLTLADRNFGFLQATVVTCALLFLILDTRKDIDDLKQLEIELASLQNGD